MVIKIIDSNEVKIGTDTCYMQVNFRKEIKEIHIDIKRLYLGNFYKKLSERVYMLYKVFNPIFDMSPSERSIRIDNLPNIPLFLQGNNHFNLEVEKDQGETLNEIARLLNTSLDNWLRIIYYISIPDHLYAEYPYLAIHYKFIESYLNYYMQMLDSEFRFNYYDEIDRMITQWT